MFMKSTKYTNTNQKIAEKKNTCKLGVFSKTHASIPYNLAIAGFMRFWIPTNTHWPNTVASAAFASLLWFAKTS